MPSSFDPRPLLVLALGGHGISAPQDISYASERQRIALLGPVLGALGESYRLLLVHGNGPQVGRLLAANQALGDLDIHTAQTQGELGYLLSQALPGPNVTLATRVVISRDVGPPVKSIGPVLKTRPEVASKRVGDGWRVVVPSPRPDAVVEQRAIQRLLHDHHVVAGGGGGVPLSPAGEPLQVVVDKDWVAALLAIALDAQCLIFATDVDGVYHAFGEQYAELIPALNADDAAQLLDAGLDAGSMAPKVASGVEFTRATQRRSIICAVEAITEAIAGNAGTCITVGNPG